jgi:LmbE family N-acetylglucosaminyl deacetylase
MIHFKKILVVAAHPDDELLSMGATLLSLKKTNEIHIVFLSDGHSSRGESISRNDGAKKFSAAINASSLHFLDFKDNRLDQYPLLDIIQKLSPIITSIAPDTIFTHWAGDLNVDHQKTHEAVFTICRPQPDFFVKNILSFEVASSTGWRSNSSSLQFSPNLIIDVTDTIELKLKLMTECYAEELRSPPHARSLDGIRAMAQFRGMQAGVPFAEAFVLERALAALKN